MRQIRIFAILILFTFVTAGSAAAGRLAWPIACIPGVDCLRNSVFHLSYPDIDGDGKAFDCGPPGYTNHTGTDITISSIEDGIAVLAAEDGEILWVSGGKFDHCPNENEPDCRAELRPVVTGVTGKSPNCTDFGPACGATDCCLSWGFNAGNFIIIKHDGEGDPALTFYAHLRKESIIVANGQRVRKGEKIAEVGSSGASLTPHLHFGIWNKRNDRFDLADPWAGKCGPNFFASLWQFDPPYRADVVLSKGGTGSGLITTTKGELNCGHNCAVTLSPGAVLNLKATPYKGSEFAGWEGSCAGQGTICTIVAEGTKNIAALFRDIAPPTVHGIALPPVTSSLTVPVTTFKATDNIGVTGYLITENPTPPPASSLAWHDKTPTSYSCSTPGKKTLFAWAKDAAGNISSGTRANLVCGAVNSAQSAIIPVPAAPATSFHFNRFFPDGT
jgi:murein DD-endopeptidase MepM/ murein hydrolase activator NlpD